MFFHSLPINMICGLSDITYIARMILLKILSRHRSTSKHTQTINSGKMILRFWGCM